MSQKQIPSDSTGPATVKKSSLKRQCDSVDPNNIIEGCRSHAPSAQASQTDSKVDTYKRPHNENQDENSDCNSKDDAGQVRTDNHDVNSVANMSDGNDLSDAFDYVPHKQKTTGKHKVAKKVQDAQKTAAPVLSVLNVQFHVPYMDGSTKVVGIVEAKAHEPYDTVYNGQTNYLQLQNQVNWEFVSKLYPTEVAKKGDSAAVEIKLPDGFLVDFQSSKELWVDKKKPYKTGTIKMAVKSKKHSPTINYFIESDTEPISADDLAYENAGYNAPYKVMEKQLLEKLKKCQICGQDKLCMTNKKNSAAELPTNLILNVGTRSSSSSRSHSMSCQHKQSPEPSSELDHGNGPLTTVEEWFTTLEVSVKVHFSGWVALRDKFDAQGALEMTLDMLGTFARDHIIQGFGLNMMEQAVVLINLSKAGQEYGFKVVSKKH
ncbi:hypothetical protein BU17DRAFT_92585 [Hysterangium stoloniferum]|nr:hypothetical protein BU17DRAFT_92585 [Hysterangium stoloniferum]